MHLSPPRYHGAKRDEVIAYVFVDYFEYLAVDIKEGNFSTNCGRITECDFFVVSLNQGESPQQTVFYIPKAKGISVVVFSAQLVAFNLIAFVILFCEQAFSDLNMCILP